MDDNHRLAFWAALILALGLSVTHTSLYVDRFLVTFLHEASHGLCAVLTGGHVQSFSIAFDTSGLCYTVGGFRPLVLLGGYAGSCLWGGAMLVASRKQGWSRPVMFALGAFMLGFTLFYGRSVAAWLVGLGYGAAFLAAGVKLRGPVAGFVLAFLATRVALDALGSLGDLLSYAHYGGPMTDAVLMSHELTHGLVPATVFALGTDAVSLAIYGCFLWLAFRPARLKPGEPGPLLID